mgnify:CR=1 FL=1
MPSREGGGGFTKKPVAKLKTCSVSKKGPYPNGSDSRPPQRSRTRRSDVFLPRP